MTAKQSATTLEARPLLRCAEPAPFGEVDEDDTAWAQRCEHWFGESHKPHRRRAMRERSKQPLILCGHGVALRVEGGALTIRNGFTHYPQKQETYRFFKGELAVPPRIVMLDGSGNISFDVLAWLSEQNVPLIRIDWQGNVQSILANNGYAANRIASNGSAKPAPIRNGVWPFAPKRRMAFCIELIARKIDNCIQTL